MFLLVLHPTACGGLCLGAGIKQEHISGRLKSSTFTEVEPPNGRLFRSTWLTQHQPGRRPGRPKLTVNARRILHECAGFEDGLAEVVAFRPLSVHRGQPPTRGSALGGEGGREGRRRGGRKGGAEGVRGRRAGASCGEEGNLGPELAKLVLTGQTDQTGPNWTKEAVLAPLPSHKGPSTGAAGDSLLPRAGRPGRAGLAWPGRHSGLSGHGWCRHAWPGQARHSF